MNDAAVPRWLLNPGRRLTRDNYVVSYAPLAPMPRKRFRDWALDRLLGLL